MFLWKQNWLPPALLRRKTLSFAKVYFENNHKVRCLSVLSPRSNRAGANPIDFSQIKTSYRRPQIPSTCDFQAKRKTRRCLAPRSDVSTSCSSLREPDVRRSSVLHSRTRFGSSIEMVSDESFASAIRANVALLQFSGVVSYKNEKIRRMNSQNILSAISYGCLSAYAILYTYEFALHTVYLDTWTESFAMILSLVGGQARFTLVLLFRGRFQRLLTICEKLWTSLNADEKRCVRDYVKATRRLTYYYLFGCAFTIFFYAVASLFMGRHDESSNATTKTLPYACPVQVHRTPYYEIMYVLQLSSMINVGLTCVAVDTIGPVLILTVCGLFKVLNSRILSLGDPRDRDNLSSPTSAESLEMMHGVVSKNCTKSYLEAYVLYHQTVFEYVEERRDDFAKNKYRY